jgi:acyl-CoA dehydrogenase
VLTALTRLLRDAPAPIPAHDVRDWWRRVRARPMHAASPVATALAAGFAADRVAGVLAGGYQAALRALVPSLDADIVVSLCATEPGGNHPRAIETRLDSAGAGFTLTGRKRWSTMGPMADVLLVLAGEGEDGAGRTRFRLVRVDPLAPGVTIGSMPPPPFVPEVPHASIELDGVSVDAGALLPGEAYARYVKPFRTVEDLHIHAALLGYLLSVARRHAWPREASERLSAAVVAVAALAALDAGAPEVHVALAGLLAQDARLIDDLAPAWAGVDAPERERWERDRALFGVAGQLRERRRQRAWESLGRG